jgi:hypothetical protein
MLRALAALLRVIGAVLLTVLSLVLHLGSANGRHALRDLLTSVLPGLVPGQLKLDAISVLNPRAIVVDGLSWSDDLGAPVVFGAHVEVSPAWRLLTAPLGKSPWPRILVRAPRVWARVPSLGPARTVQGEPPAGPSPPLTLRLPQITLDVERLENALGGPWLTLRNLRGDASINIVRDAPEVTLRLLRTDIWLGALAPIHLDGAAEVHHARAVAGRVDLVGEPLRCEIRAASPGGDVSISLRRCAFSAKLLSTLADAPVPAVEITEATLLRHTNDALAMNATLRVGGDVIGLSGAVNGGSYDLAVFPQRASLRWLSPDVPPLSLDGEVRAHATQSQGRWSFDATTHALTASVQGVNIPGLDLDGTFEGTTLRLTSLRVPSLHLTAQGSYDTAQGPSSARASLRSRATPLDALGVPGVALRGDADLDGSLRGDTGSTRVELAARATRFAGFGARVESARLSANLDVREGRNDLRAHVELSGARYAQHGPLSLTVNVRGDAPRDLAITARATGPLPPAARRHLHGSTFALDLDGAVQHVAPVTRLRLRRADLHAGQLTLRADAHTALRSGARGSILDAVEASLTLPGDGRVRARLVQRRLDLDLRDVSLRAFAPFVPQLAPLGGVVNASGQVDLARPGRSRLELRVENLTAPVLGRISPQLSLRPQPDGSSALRLVWNADTPGGESDIDLRVPRALGDLDGWIDGVRRGALSLPPIDLAALQDLLPRGTRARGTVTPRLVLSRRDPQTLAVELAVEGRDLVAGVGVLRLQRDLVAPLRARARACGLVDPRRNFSDPWAVRVAVGLADENTDAPPDFGCTGDARPLTTPLVDASAGVEGAWREVLTALTPAALRALPPGLAARMRSVPVRASVDIGPLTRARWPLRSVRVPGMPASMRRLLAPEVEPETRVALTARLGGTLGAPTLDAHVEASSTRLAQAGITVPLRAAVDLAVRPTGDSLIAPLRVEGAVRGELAPEAPPTERSLLTGTAAAELTLARILQNPRDLDVRALSAAAQNVRLEHFSDLAAKGLRGGVDLSARRTGDPARPYESRVTLREMRTIPPGLERLAASIPPVSAVLQAHVTQEGAEAETVHACLLASPGAVAGECAPRDPETDFTVADGVLRADVALPFPRSLLAPPDLRQLGIALRASAFRVDALGALAPSRTVTDLGGVLSATLHWRGSDVARPVGHFELRDGRATLASLGEPFNDLNVTMSVEGRRIHIERFDGRLGIGTMQVTGDALLGHGDEIARVALEARTRELPAVSGGHTWAWITGAMGTELTLRRDGIFVGVRVHEASVRVQDEPARALIPLSADPAVFVSGRTRLTRVEAADVVPIDVTFTLETPMSLRRSDFLVAINGSGNIHMDRAGTAVAANFESARTSSWVSFYGKRFDLERVSVSLDGSANVNPQIELVARHDTGANGDIVLSMRGRLYDPQITMSAASQPDLGMAEVISLLILGRRDSGPTTGQTDLATQAGDMARSLVTGLTLGFVTSTLRAQFAFLPTLIAEPGSTDAGRYGAGFNLGPRVYLQATWGTTSSAVGLGTRPAGTQEFRVLLEYAITSALSGSATYGTWQEYGSWQNNAGIDVFWSP